MGILQHFSKSERLARRKARESKGFREKPWEAQIRTRLDVAKSSKSVAKRLYSAGFRVSLSIWVTERAISLSWLDLRDIQSLDDVHQVRQKLREIFAAWEDKIDYISKIGDVYIFRYRGKAEGFDIFYDLKAPGEDGRALLGKLSPGCKFETVTYEEEKLVCKS